MSTTKKVAVNGYTAHTYSVVGNNLSDLTPEMQSRIASHAIKSWEKTQLNLLDGQRRIWEMGISKNLESKPTQSLRGLRGIVNVSTTT
jgi:hypothetical protein